MPRVKKNVTSSEVETSKTEGQETDVKVDVVKKSKTKTKPTVKIPGLEVLEEALGSDYGVVLKQCEKFMRRHGIKLTFHKKFMAFKCLNNRGVHVDWITFTDLMKIYDCRVRQPQTPIRPPQRPYVKNRIY